MQPCNFCLAIAISVPCPGRADDGVCEVLGPAGPLSSTAALLSLQRDAPLTFTSSPSCLRAAPRFPSSQDNSHAYAWEQHHQLSNLSKYSSYQVTGKKSLLLLMLLMENFSPFAAAFKASCGFIQTLSCSEPGEVKAQRESARVVGNR